MRTFESPDFKYMDPKFHTNAVEVLRPEYAKAFPMFAAGDLLVSMRDLSLVSVIDGKTAKPKWWLQAFTLKQHDPHFLPDGSISIFDNRMGTGSSRIVKIFPASGMSQTVFEGTQEHPFYSWRRGKHQPLANGHWLVTETEHGRVFEINSSGELIWAFNNRFDDHRNGLVTKAMILPRDYFKPNVFRCEGDAL
jgi:hypothetical protein